MKTVRRGAKRVKKASKPPRRVRPSKKPSKVRPKKRPRAAAALPVPASPAARAARAVRAGLSVQDAILAGVLDPLLIIDGVGTVERASGSSARVFGWEPHELVGRNIKILMPEPYRSEHDGYLAAYRKTGKSALLGKTREFPIVRKDGVVIVCEMSVSRIDVPGRPDPLFTGSFRDITERKRAAEDAERASARERAMLKALATIGESSAILAHEIKNPITALNVALRAVADKLGSEDREVVDDLAARLRKVEAMIRRTLSFTRPLDLKIERIAPKDLAAKVATALAPRLKQWPNVVFRQECRAKEPIEIDVDLMVDVASNLVMNAVEAADGTRVRIRARCMDDGPDRVRFEVEDDGPGFADSVLSKVFLPFVTTKATGTGLGLAWCKKIVDEHGGSLTVHRVEPKGAMMRMLLPRTSLR